MMNRKVRTKLDYQPGTSENQIQKSESINQHDREYKLKVKSNAENRNTRPHNITLGDYVLLKQMKKNKYSTAFEPAFYIVYRIDGSSIAARRVTDGREVYRDASMFKLVNSVVQNLDQEKPAVQQMMKPKDWREDLFLKIKPSEVEYQGVEIAPEKVPEPVPEPECEPIPEPVQQVVHETQPAVRVRPQRTRRRPGYLQDYVEK